MVKKDKKEEEIEYINDESFFWAQQGDSKGGPTFIPADSIKAARWKVTSKDGKTVQYEGVVLKFDSWDGIRKYRRMVFEGTKNVNPNCAWGVFLDFLKQLRAEQIWGISLKDGFDIRTIAGPDHLFVPAICTVGDGQFQHRSIALPVSLVDKEGKVLSEVDYTPAEGSFKKAEQSEETPKEDTDDILTELITDLPKGSWTIKELTKTLMQSNKLGLVDKFNNNKEALIAKKVITLNGDVFTKTM